jgi:hypothetical protein
MSRALVLAVIAALAFTLAGCEDRGTDSCAGAPPGAVTSGAYPHGCFVQGSDAPAGTQQWDRREVARDNYIHTAYYRHAEAPFYQPATPTGTRLPQVCLAMSGGGLRSAAVNLGVLLGFGSKFPAQRFDVISAVSGGSYAMAAYLAARVRLNLSHEEFVKRPDFIKNQLADHANFIDTQTKLDFGIQTIIDAAPTTALGYLQELDDTTSDATEDPTVTPTAPTEKYADIINNTFIVHSSKDEPLFPPLRALSGIAIPVFNLSVYGSNLSVSGSVFEITPLRFGYDGAGYTTVWPDDLDLPLAAALSGSAIDGHHGIYGGLLNLTRLGLGGVVWFSPVSAERLDAISLAGADPPARGQHRVRRSVSDGGFADNLGILSLVKRLCDNIVVVDAEHDPDLVFEGYRKARDAISADMSAAFCVPDIEAVLPDDKRAKERGCSPAAPPPTRPTFATFVTPIMQGCITRFPFPAGPYADTAQLPGSVVDVSPSVTYIKLSVDSNHLERYPSSVVKAYNASSRDDPRGSRFPQHSTHIQSFTPELWLAYVELGETLGKSVTAENLTNYCQLSLDHSTPG